jgi:hypothetical protein
MKSVVIRTIIELAISFCIISGANGINTVNAATESPTVADTVLQSYENKGIVVYQDDDITVRSFGTDPVIASAIEHASKTVHVGVYDPNVGRERTTATGHGGIARLNASDSGRAVYWQVKPSTAWPFEFTGSVKLAYHSGFKRTANVFGVGAFGSTVSGEVTMHKNRGDYAKLTGKAYSLNGVKYTVLPGVGTSF